MRKGAARRGSLTPLIPISVPKADRRQMLGLEIHGSRCMMLRPIDQIRQGRVRAAHERTTLRQVKLGARFKRHVVRRAADYSPSPSGIGRTLSTALLADHSAECERLRRQEMARQKALAAMKCLCRLGLAYSASTSPPPRRQSGCHRYCPGPGNGAVWDVTDVAGELGVGVNCSRAAQAAPAIARVA